MAFSQEAQNYASEQLERRREAYATLTDKRIAEVHDAVPQLNALERTKKTLAIAKIKAKLKANDEECRRLDAGIHDINDRINTALKAAGFTAEDLGEKHFCSICADKGYLEDGKPCQCRTALMSRYETERVSKLSPLSVSNFESFDLTFYSSTPSADFGDVSPRENAQGVLQRCKSFVSSFPTNSNLLLLGSSGLGKTHLALSIAGSLIERGHDVIYCSCSNIFSVIEEERADYSKHSDTLDSLKHCSLLVLDDLGSERAGASVSAMLYDIVNTRLSHSLSTIITTNLTDTNLFSARYGEKITSRLIGCYEPLALFGEDIRLKKNGF